MTLGQRAWVSLVALTAVMGGIVFASAGTLLYWEGWLYLAEFLGASAVITLDLIRRDPSLLERRMRGGPTAEPDATQRIVMSLAAVCFVALLVVPGLNRRWHWTSVPAIVVWLGVLGVGVGFWGILRVYRENTYTAATVQVAAGQTVIATGPYAVVRHPMYACALLYMVGTPLALASYWGLAVLAPMVPVLIARILSEERILSRELKGYPEYQTRVAYRLLPGLW